MPTFTVVHDALAVAHFKLDRERFEECCARIEAVLDRVSAFLPSFAALGRRQRNTYSKRAN